jgi:CBS domain containing-hemolysin-like protein
MQLTLPLALLRFLGRRCTLWPRRIAAPLLALPSAAHASFLPPALMDSAAWGIAWFVVVFIPIGAIVLFWMVHVLPEKIAEKRHHPQKDAIQVLCLLSLVFGGLLWPIAWLWAYTKPVMHRLAFGTEKHDEYFLHMAERAEAGQVDEIERAHLLEELDAIASRGTLSREQKQARARIAAAPAAPAVAAAPTGAA